MTGRGKHIFRYLDQLRVFPIHWSLDQVILILHRIEHQAIREHEQIIGEHQELFSSHGPWYCTDHSQRYGVHIGIVWELTPLFCHCHSPSPTPNFKLPSVQPSDRWFIRHLGMRALSFGNLLQSNTFSRMQSKPGKAVSSHSQSFLFRFSDPLSLDQCGSVYRRCVPSSPQNFHEEMRTCDFAHSFLGTTDFNSCFDGCPSAVLSQKVHGDGIVFLELLRHHLFILYDRSISAQVQEEKKGPKSHNAFRKVYFAQGGPCCLHFSYCNRRFYSLLGSGKDYEVCHRYEAKQPFTHVAPDLGSVKLSHEFSDLLRKNACLQRGILKYLSKDVSLVELRVCFGLNIHQSTFISSLVLDACLLDSWTDIDLLCSKVLWGEFIQLLKNKNWYDCFINSKIGPWTWSLKNVLDIINDIALKKVTVIIIHSKYLSCSDSLKSHAKISIICYCRPNTKNSAICKKWRQSWS